MSQSDEPRRLARHFRWQALFDHSADPLFLLNRRHRLLFVNRAWETLTGIAAAEAADLVCRRPRPASPGDAWEDVLQHALTPPVEALEGAPARVRRLLPGRETRQWWEVDFLPLRPGGKSGGFFLLGRIRALPPEAPTSSPLPERLANLRQRAVARCSLDLWAASEVPAVRRLVAQARLAAQVTVPVLLVGEPGVGKQALARAIHYQGPRRELAFAALDCRRLPPLYVVATLFAPPGPASPGAIYLREPASLPREWQSKLAESLAETPSRPDRPRLLASSCTPLAEAVASGSLLEDLACQLGTLVLEVPPLRQRPGDLPALVEKLLARANSESAVPVAGLAADAWEVVRAYSWPGNVRQLYSALASAQARCQGDRIKAADLPAPVCRAVRLDQSAGGPAPKPLPLDQLLQQAERRLLDLALRRAGGNLTRAARDLGIWRQRLARRLEALEIAGTEIEIDEDEPAQPE
jgi:transcriptional regulator with PAS, ATPase and Fis domain